MFAVFVDGSCSAWYLHTTPSRLTVLPSKFDEMPSTRPSDVSLAICGAMGGDHNPAIIALQAAKCSRL